MAAAEPEHAAAPPLLQLQQLQQAAAQQAVQPSVEVVEVAVVASQDDAAEVAVAVAALLAPIPAVPPFAAEVLQPDEMPPFAAEVPPLVLLPHSAGPHFADWQQRPWIWQATSESPARSW